MKYVGTASVLFLIVGIICATSYKIIGSTIDKDGYLIEPFALIPIGWLSILLSIVCAFVFVLMYMFRK